MTDLITRESASFARELRGLVSTPGDDRYAAATAIWARQTDVKPHAVVHCRTANDVQAAIRAARERALPLSVRGGGHDWAGRALCNGIVIDLSAMRGVTLDCRSRTVTVGGGARVSDVTAFTDGHNAAVAAGSVASVGIAGLTLGGGYGPLIGRVGLALDNLLEAEVVLADGQIMSASAKENEELFWALRGGGGNFGVVTAMRHRLHALPSVHSGLLVYPFAEAQSVLDNCAAIANSMPDEFSVQIGIAAGPDGSFAVLVIPTWSGAPEDGQRRLAPMTKLGSLLSGTIEKKSYRALLQTFDGFIVDGLRVLADTCCLPGLDSDTIETLVSAMTTAVSPGCAIFTHDFKGAASRVAPDATAFALRRDHVMVEIIALLPGPSSTIDEQTHRDWVHATGNAFARPLGGGYPNMLGRGEADRAALSFGRNAERLVRAKRRYDPDNVFSSAIPLPNHFV